MGKLRDQWSNVQNIHLKTSSSPALPIYAKASSEVVAFVKSHSGRSNDDEVNYKQNLIIFCDAIIVLIVLTFFARRLRNKVVERLRKLPNMEHLVLTLLLRKVD